jgi:hypothetical protein
MTIHERRASRRRRLVLAVAAMAAVASVHDVGRLLRRPFWLDETWVAASIRAPWSKLPMVSVSTPLGWTLLLRAIPRFDDEALRLLPLAFAAVAVVLAWDLGRHLPIGPWAPPMLAGVVLLAPTMLQRNDLKQYTTDAAGAIVLLLLVARLEERWTRGRLWTLVVVIVVAEAFSHVALLVGPAVVVSLLAVTARQRERLRDVALAGAVAAVGLIGTYAVLDRPRENDAFRRFWDAYYLHLDDGLVGVIREVGRRFAAVSPATGVGFIVVAGALGIVGAVVLTRCGRPAVALTASLAFVWQALLAGAERYPFLDERTSTYLLVLWAVLIAVAAAALARLAAQRFTKVAGTIVALGLSIIYVVTNLSSVRADTIPFEDVKAQVAAVEEGFADGDVILVNLSGSWGFAYYDARHWRPHASGVVATAWVPAWPDEPVVAAADRDSVSIRDALAAADRRVAPRGRIWLVRSHVIVSEQAAWTSALAGRSVEVLPVGREPLLVIQPPARA